MSKENQIKRDIQKDMDEIEFLLLENNNSEDELTKLHIKIDGKYQSKINNWGKSCYNWDEKTGFDYKHMGIEALNHNLFFIPVHLCLNYITFTKNKSDLSVF